MVGTPKIPENGVMWDAARVGKIYSCGPRRVQLYEFDKIMGDYKEVEVVDGLLIATQADVRWRDDLFDKWHFYDASSGFEMRRAGYKVVVPRMDEPWVLHDDGVLGLNNYHTERKKFVKEYLS